jgi:hypothetical protein
MKGFMIIQITFIQDYMMWSYLDPIESFKDALADINKRLTSETSF